MRCRSIAHHREPRPGAGLVHNKEGMTLLKHAAWGGFRNMTVTFLKKLFAHLKVPWVPGKKPSTEVPLVAALVKHAVGPEATNQMVEAALVARGKTVMNAKLLADTQAFDPNLFDDEDDDDVRRQFEKLKSRREAAQKQEQARLDKLAQLQPDVPATLSEPSISLVPALMTGYSQEEASKWLPKFCSIYKDARRQNRWRVRSRFWPEKCWSYGTGSFTDDYGAMKLCLLHAWRMERERVGVQCPFDFR